MSSEVSAYLARLRAHLALGDEDARDVVRELSQHIDDRAEALVRRGASPQQARRQALAGFGRPRALAQQLRQARLLTSWGEALLGAGAFALAALVIGPGLWRQPLVAAGAAALVVALTLYGLWLGRPAWFYPWAGIALSLPIVAGYVAFAVLRRAYESGLGDPRVLAGTAGAALYFPLGLLVVVLAVLVAVRRDWLDASVLLSPLPGVLAWVIAVHRDGGLLAGGGASATSALLAGVYLSMAVVAVVLLRAPTRAAKLAALVASAPALLIVASVLADPAGDVVVLAARSTLLVGFLLSPALVARSA